MGEVGLRRGKKTSKGEISGAFVASPIAQGALEHRLHLRFDPL